MLPFLLYLCLMKNNTHITPFAISLFSLLFLSACKDNPPKEGLHLPQELFREGDIVFRRGTGFTSRIVLAADSEGRYSHTGILKKERGAWYVIHAVPGEPDFKGDADRIKMEPVERFFDAEKASRGAVMHVQADSTLACGAARSALGLFRKHLLFDHDYDLNDTTEMYCTELIDYVYRKEGIDLSEGRTTSVNIPGMSGDYLMPNDIAQSGRLCLIYCF